MTISKSPSGRGLRVRVRTKGLKASSARWLERQLNDPYVAEAKSKGYRSRAAFKLIELDDKFHFLKGGARVLDLGAAKHAGRPITMVTAYDWPTGQLADAAGSRRLIGGQMEDLLAEGKASATADELEFIHLNKTAAMLEASLVMGGLVGGLAEPHLTTLRTAGRQLGLAFYKHLLTNFSSTDSVAVLDASIRSVAPDSSLGEQLRRFAATSGALMKAPSPAGFGFPARAEGGFTMPVIDPQALLASRTLTQSVPSVLQPYGSLPVVRKAVNGTYGETIKVPANSTLSVVIQ